MQNSSIEIIENSSKVDFTVIMPALNEEKNIIPAITNTLKAFADYNINGEIIVINDGSTDETEKLIYEISRNDSRIRLISHEKPRGVGTSYWEAVDAASGNIITWLPGDNENDAYEGFRYYKLLEHVDIIVPFVFNKEVRSLFRNSLSFIYRFIINSTFGVNFNYTNGTILFRKSILKELNHRGAGFFFQTDILIRAVRKGYLFAEVPYKLGIRKEGISRAVTFPSLLNVIKGYVRLVKDLYFKKDMNEKDSFVGDSMTARRRDENSIRRSK
jgi:dolichol-phosphate mannosyltransferase